MSSVLLYSIISTLLLFFLLSSSTIAYPQQIGTNGNIISAISSYQGEVERWLNVVEKDLAKFNSLASTLTWILSTNPTEKVAKQAMELGKARSTWKYRVCRRSDVNKSLLNDEQNRKIYLLCRGPIYTQKLTEMYLKVMGKLVRNYNTDICLSELDVDGKILSELDMYAEEGQDTSWYPQAGECLYGEPDLERLMKRNDLNPNQKRFIWESFHDTISEKTKKLYPTAVKIQNKAAQENGYSNIGEAWREELEIENLEAESLGLYEQIKEIYIYLHAVVRHKLYLKYGKEVVDEKGPIPIHLLGNMWGQDWSPLLELFVPKNQSLNLDQRLKAKKWTVKDMVLQAEDMYASFGLPRMTQKFWNFSIFEENENVSFCHGTAANMFARDDFRMLLCAKVTMEDFYVIHHEMGHLQYYMAYQEQSPIFQDGANSAMHESIGDAVMHGVMTPQHLHRLGLLTDQELNDPNVELYLLFKQALAKIPEVPFALLVDKYRWDIFKGKITPEQYNKAYWDINLKLRGVKPPGTRPEDGFDAGAKFHVPDNTPYIRYFLSSILQMQVFKGICENSYNSGNPIEANPELILPLHKCDIYGSKKSGKRLRQMLEKGSSVKWSEAMKIATGEEIITTAPFLEYYKPIALWLQKYILLNNVHVGW